MQFKKREQKDLLKSWLVISLAFALVIAGVGFTTTWLVALLTALAISLVTAGLGFVVHETAHKFIAEQENCHAEYRANNSMLIIALITSLFGIVIAAPGAVHVSGHPSPSQRGKTALAGPAANLILGILFLILSIALDGFWGRAAMFGSMINVWLGLFNMLPFGPFDGAKVFTWNKIVYGVTVGIAVILAFINGPL
ncbi:metalloprotease [Candidatus Woesearchaeota archaeon]|nr:metalloprotease [Candidatus Woesearchaeota archaeon]